MRPCGAALSALLLLTACSGSGSPTAYVASPEGPSDIQVEEGVQEYPAPPAVSQDCLPDQIPCDDTPTPGYNSPLGEVDTLFRLAPKIRHIFASFGTGGTFQVPPRQSTAESLLGSIGDVLPGPGLNGIRAADIQAGDYRAFAFWGEHVAVVGRLKPGTIYHMWEAGPRFAGYPPVGPARWAGPVVGQHIRTGGRSDGQVDLVLSSEGLFDVGIDLSNGWSHDWSDIRPTDKGTLAIYGLHVGFHGDNHEEAAGWFREGDMTGIFAASRD